MLKTSTVGDRDILSLEELEGDYWGTSPWGLACLDRSYNLRRVPVQDLDPEEILFLIGQQIGVTHLLPRALKLLKYDPLWEVECYPGDLLENVLKVDVRFYLEHTELCREVVEVATVASRYLPLAPARVMRSVNEVLVPLVREYLAVFNRQVFNQQMTDQSV